MTSFTCIAIPTETAERFRASGIDDNGNTIRQVLSTGGTGSPCRHCLEFAAAGEMMLLGSYNLPRPLGIYWTPSPIFIHERICTRFARPGTVAPIVAQGTQVSVRAYDAAHQCLYDLGHVSPGSEIDAHLARALADPRTAFVNIHTARPGCMLTLVERTATAL